jgi:hypothetical protein
LDSSRKRKESVATGALFYKGNQKKHYAMAKNFETKRTRKKMNYETSFDERYETMPHFIPQEPPMEHYGPPLRAPPIE